MEMRLNLPNGLYFVEFSAKFGIVEAKILVSK